MEHIYNTVAERLGIDPKEVELIYKDYTSIIRKEMLLTPEREIYMEKFGKFVPSIFKLKNKLRAAFKKRNKERVKIIINTLKQLNYKPKKHTQ
jgi:hypothetical protein